MVHSPIYIIATDTLKAIDDEEVWCYCQKFISDTTLIGCDTNNCKVQWFHMTCIGLDVAPTDSWFCPTCKQNLRQQINTCTRYNNGRFKC